MIHGLGVLIYFFWKAVHMRDIQNEWKIFENTVWKTRTARIHSEKRCLDAAAFYQAMNIYYSCIVVALSLLNYASFIDVCTKEKIGMLSLVMSICLMLVILKLNPDHYRELSNKYKTNHIALQNLVYEIANIKPSDNILEYQKRYVDILRLCPNHTEQDYREGVYDSRYNDDLTWQRCKLSYYVNIVIAKICRLFWIVLPIIIMFFVYIV